jgi:hypothetical protein
MQRVSNGGSTKHLVAESLKIVETSIATSHSEMNP